MHYYYKPAPPLVTTSHTNTTRRNNDFNIKSIYNELEVIRDLGVLVDRELKFTSHIDSIVKKAFSMLGFLRRNTADFKLIHTRKILYNALVRSHLEYACVAWNPVYTVHSQRLESVQRAFTRHLAYVSPGISHRAPYDQRLSFLKMNTLRDRRRRQDLEFLHGLLNGRVNSSELLAQIRFSVPAHVPRHPIKKTFCLPMSKTNLGRHAPLPRCCSAYNEIIKSADIFHESRYKFRRSLTDALLSTKE